jgi:hypothetical protein
VDAGLPHAVELGPDVPGGCLARAAAKTFVLGAPACAALGAPITK